MPKYTDNKKEEDFVKDTGSTELEPVSDLVYRTKLKVEPKKQGKVALVTPTKVIINYEGNGISILFDASKHATLKLEDAIDIP